MILAKYTEKKQTTTTTPISEKTILKYQNKQQKLYKKQHKRNREIVKQTQDQKKHPNRCWSKNKKHKQGLRSTITT